MWFLAVDDGGFRSGAPGKRGGKTLFLGVIVSDSKIEKLLLSTIEIDGLDATEKLIDLVKTGREVVDFILLPSISCGGFNLIAPEKVYAALKIPLIVVNRKEPNDARVEQALRTHFPDWENRLAIVRSVGHPKKLILSNGQAVFFHVFGLKESMARVLIRKIVIFGRIPEPLRIAHIIAHGLSEKNFP